MRILGIDPGYGTTGFGLIESERGSHRAMRYGVVTTPVGLELAQRLVILYDDITQLLESFQPEAVAMEELFWGNNITTGIGVAQARGVILLAVAKYGLSISSYTPMQVKQAVVGYGKAEKRQVMDMTRRLLKLDAVPRPDDAADALAVALCHGRTATSSLSQFGRSLGREG